MEQKTIRSRVIDLCSEDAYGSWELWWSLGPKETETLVVLRDQFVLCIQELIADGTLLALKKSDHNLLSVVALDVERLKYEIQNSSRPVPLDYFWFDLESNEGRVAGTRYQYPDGRGVRVLPGSPLASDAVKRGPYSRTIDIDNVSGPIPLDGNPAL